MDSVLCATVAVAIGAAPQDHFFVLALAGAIGGTLPDIDVRKTSRTRYGALGAMIASMALSELRSRYSLAELLIIWVGIYLAVSSGAYAVPSKLLKLLKHRGIFHSQMAGLFFAALTAVICDRVFGESAALAWLTGLFVFIGFLIHLILDEIYAVKGGKVKRSFGSALKMVDKKSPLSSALMACALGMVMFWPELADYSIV